MADTEQLAIRVPTALMKRVRAEAQKETRTASNMVRVLLEEALKRRKS